MRRNASVKKGISSIISRYTFFSDALTKRNIQVTISHCIQLIGFRTDKLFYVQLKNDDRLKKPTVGACENRTRDLLDVRRRLHAV